MNIRPSVRFNRADRPAAADPRVGLAVLLALCAIFTAGGCAGPGPRLFPAVPVNIKTLDGGRCEHWYDTNGDGKADYCERLSPPGLVESIGYDADQDGISDDDVELSKTPAAEIRHLVLLLDSVPFGMVQDLRQQGRLRYFHPPARVLSPFPVMTDVCFSEFLGISPCPGLESAYYDGRRLTEPYAVYLHSANAGWETHLDYHLNHLAHAGAYTSPLEWFGHELRCIRETFLENKQPITIAYVVSTSALGARIGRNGHQTALIQLDRFCQSLVHETRGRVRITMLSDHGHNLVSSRRIPLPDILASFGYRETNALKKPGDVVVPEFGMVTCAAIYTQNPRQVAADLTGVEGIDLTAYLDERDNVVVLSRRGGARIAKSAKGLRYKTDSGDPLELTSIIKQLAKNGRVDHEGFIEDRVLFEATVNHLYPDAAYRLWRAFHGLVVHRPDVLVSVEDGWHCGSPTMSRMIPLAAAHGNLKMLSSSAFAATMNGPLPAVLRMEDLRAALQQTGVPLQHLCTQTAAPVPGTAPSVAQGRMTTPW